MAVMEQEAQPVGAVEADAAEPSLRRASVRLHGHDVTYVEAGDRGPVVVLLHGIAGSSHTWDLVIGRLAQHMRIVAPDLLGHGESAKPRGDYSLGAFAAGVRDLLELLGHERVSIVGHSLGGGVAMQFAYQFPERTERLALVSSGGLGPEVTMLLRAATLPGSELVLPLLTHRYVRGAAGAVARLATLLPGVRLRPSTAEIARSLESLAETSAQRAFITTARGVMDLRGQRIDARDRLYLAEQVPLLLVWGGCDAFIPATHGIAAAGLVPGSRLELFERSGHFPHIDEPERFADVLIDFVATTEPARIKAGDVREQLLAGS